MDVSPPLDRPPRIELIGPGRHARGREAYQLHGLWCVHLYRWDGKVQIRGRELKIEPGYAALYPPDTFFTHVWPNMGNLHLFAHFALDGRQTVTLPAVQPLPDFEAWWHRFADAAVSADRMPMRAQAEVWSLLWRLADHEASQEEHPALRTAIRIIAERLDSLPTVNRIAEESGVSHNHLIRLFRQAYGETVQGYVRRRRFERARYLLENSTKPIKAIAREVGCADSQTFNKLMRDVGGQSPRQIRAGRVAGLRPE